MLFLLSGSYPTIKNLLNLLMLIYKQGQKWKIGGLHILSDNLDNITNPKISGIGTKLLQAAIILGLYSYGTEIDHISEDAIEFYKKNGFTIQISEDEDEWPLGILNNKRYVNKILKKKGEFLNHFDSELFKIDSDFQEDYLKLIHSM
jgi:hypothetical protein